MANPTYEFYEPIAGGFRARLAETLPIDAEGSTGLIGVSLNASGRVVKGTEGQSGLIGVMLKNVARGPIAAGANLHSGTPNPNAIIQGTRPGDPVDVMTNGAVANLDVDDFPAGSKVYVAEDGTVSTTGGAGSIQVGHTIVAGYVIIRFVPGVAAQA